MTADTARDSRVTLARVIRGEWIKLRGQRSSLWIVALTIAVPLLVIAVWASNADAQPDRPNEINAVVGSVTSSIFETLVLVVLLGALVGTNEYDTRTITTTMAAVPQRWPVVVAKVVIVAAVTAVVTVVVALLGFFISAAIVPMSTPVGLGDEGVAAVLLGTVLFETSAAVIATCIGLVLRSNLGAIAGAFGFLYVIPGALNQIPVGPINTFAQTFPGTASDALISILAAPERLPYPVSAVAVVLWTAVWIVIAVAVTKRRDV